MMKCSDVYGGQEMTMTGHERSVTSHVESGKGQGEAVLRLTKVCDKPCKD